ncbi:protein rai1 [Geopyxis carbonaria]|nr:protein rai1 [Geopyxis carbonaria]
MASYKFQLEPLSRFAGQNFCVRKPTELTCFSYDDNHEYKYDDSSLRYYYNPQLNINLSEGFDRFVKHDDTIDEHLDSLLAAIEALERESGTTCNTDIMTWRGMLTKIMSLPFDKRNGFEMNAVSFQGTIFIEENHEFKIATRAHSNQRQDTMSYWGYKFEALATLPKQWDDCSRREIELRSSEIVSNKAQFCSIVKTAFDDVKLILGGEVDAVWDKRCGPINNYVELKTSKEIETERDGVAFERKLQRFWSQSFLLGVDRIICGFRDNDGQLMRVQQFDTQDIPILAKKSGRNLWDGKFSIDFTTSFLKWLKITITGDHVWRIRFQKNSSYIEAFQINSPDFISDSFKHWRNSFKLEATDGLPVHDCGSLASIDA